MKVKSRLAIISRRLWLREIVMASGGG